MIMNKMKYLVFIFLGLFFAGFERVDAASTAITYDLSSGRLYAVADAKFLQKISELKVICNNREIAMSYFTGQEENTVSLETSLDRLDEGENYCKLKFKTTNGKEYEKLNTLVYLRRAAVNDKSCSLVLSGFDTGEGQAERDCKSKGCLWDDKNMLCSTYSNYGFSERYTLDSIIQSDIVNPPSNGSNTPSSNGGYNNGANNNSGDEVNNGEPVAANFCADVKSTIKILGYIISVIKVLVPVIIVIMGTADFYKAVTGGKSDDLKKQAILFGKRIIAGLVIFFIPTILNIVIGVIDPNNSSDYTVCTTCLFNPSNC